MEKKSGSRTRPDRLVHGSTSPRRCAIILGACLGSHASAWFLFLIDRRDCVLLSLLSHIQVASHRHVSTVVLH